jgi:hypothetical protein
MQAKTAKSKNIRLNDVTFLSEYSPVWQALKAGKPSRSIQYPPYSGNKPFFVKGATIKACQSRNYSRFRA